jgi:hypothetical protein
MELSEPAYSLFQRNENEKLLTSIYGLSTRCLEANPMAVTGPRSQRCKLTNAQGQFRREIPAKRG